VREGEDVDSSDTDISAADNSQVDPIRSTARRGAASQALADFGDRLLADARDACRREGIAATRRELVIRVAARSGLSQIEVARGLRGTRRYGAAAQVSARLDARHLHDRVSQLAATILGAREREVFLARRAARPHDMAALRELATNLSLSIERIYELEASARRKLATALG